MHRVRGVDQHNDEYGQVEFPEVSLDTGRAGIGCGIFPERLGGYSTNLSMYIEYIRSSVYRLSIHALLDTYI